MPPAGGDIAPSAQDPTREGGGTLGNGSVGLTKAHDLPEEYPKGPAEMRRMYLVTFRPWGQHFSVYLPQVRSPAQLVHVPILEVSGLGQLWSLLH